MNCCHGNNDHQDHEHKSKHTGHLSHMWMMALCCGAPAILLLLLPLIGRTFPGTSSYISRIIPFLCPVMMLAMIPMMFKRSSENAENKPGDHKQLKNDVQDN